MGIYTLAHTHTFNKLIDQPFSMGGGHARHGAMATLSNSQTVIHECENCAGARRQRFKNNTKEEMPIKGPFLLPLSQIHT